MWTIPGSGGMSMWKECVQTNAGSNDTRKEKERKAKIEMDGLRKKW